MACLRASGGPGVFLFYFIFFYNLAAILVCNTRGKVCLIILLAVLLCVRRNCKPGDRQKVDSLHCILVLGLHYTGKKYHHLFLYQYLSLAHGRGGTEESD